MTPNRTGRGSFVSWLFHWGPAVIWMGMLFYFSSLRCRPPTPGLEGFRWDDKFQHAAAYAILAALVWRALGNAGSRRWRVIASIAICAAYGATDEIHQAFVPGRECALSDWIFDTLGAITSSVILSLVCKFSKHKK